MITDFGVVNIDSEFVDNDLVYKVVNEYKNKSGNVIKGLLVIFSLIKALIQKGKHTM